MLKFKSRFFSETCTLTESGALQVGGPSSLTAESGSAKAHAVCTGPAGLWLRPQEQKAFSLSQFELGTSRRVCMSMYCGCPGRAALTVCPDEAPC